MPNLKIVDLYTNFIQKYDKIFFTSYMDKINPSSWGKVDGKYQIVVDDYGLNKPDSVVYYNGMHTKIVYYSPKYEQYQIVSLKRYAGGSLIYNLQGTFGKAYNTQWLDVYFDTIFTSSNAEIFDAPANSDLYYSYFGNDITELVTRPINVDYDEVSQPLSKQLYFKETHSVGDQKFSIDKPTDFQNDYDVVYDTTEVIYNFYRYFDKNNDSDFSDKDLRLYNFDLYENLKDVYSFMDTDSTIDIISLNDEWSIVSQDRVNVGIDTVNTSILTSIDEEEKQLIITPSETINASDIFESDILNCLNFLIELIEDTYENNIFTDKPVNEIFSFDKYYYLLNYYTDNNITNLKDFIESQSVVNDFAVNLTMNSLGFGFFKIGSNEIWLRNASTFTFDKEQLVEKFNDSNTIKVEADTTADVTLSNTEYVPSAGDNYNIDIDNKQLIADDSTSDFKSFITYDDITTSGVDRLDNMDFKILPTNINLKHVFFDNEYVDSTRFQVYGCAINLTESDSNTISNLTDFNSLKQGIESGEIVVEKYPVPMMYDLRNMNVAPGNVISQINSQFSIETYLENNLFYDTTNFINLYEKKDEILNWVIDATGILSSYDIDSFKTLNEDSLIYSMYEFRNNVQPFNLIFMVMDKLSDTYSLFELNFDDYNYYWHNNRYYTYTFRNSQSIFLQNVEGDFSSEKIEAGVVNYFRSRYEPYSFVKCIYLDELRMLNANNLNGQVNKVTLKNLTFYNYTTLDTQYGDVEILDTDFTTDGYDWYINLSEKLTPGYHIIGTVNATVEYEKNYESFTYKDFFQLYMKYNLSDFDRSFNYNVTASFVPLSGSSVNIVNINSFPNKLESILPQVVYNKNISISLFDIKSDPQASVPDNKLCMLLDHFYGTNFSTYDMTSIEGYDSTIDDLVLFDRYTIEYDRYSDQWKSAPHLVKGNIDKYTRVWLKMEIDPLSESLIDTFSYSNLFNVGLYDETKGVLVCDGKLGDLDQTTNFEELLKMYKIGMILTVGNNVNNNILVPITVTLTSELYDTYSDFTNYIDSTSIELDDTILIDIKNRGEFIESVKDWYPKIFRFIEYYDVYPQYYYQSEKDEVYNLELKLTSSDTTQIKVSELFFDVLHSTEDLYFAIPIDYEEHEDPEEEIDDVVWSNDKDAILDYINYLIRFKCPDCGDMTYQFNVKCKPAYFGFNIMAFTIGVYSYNVKVEWFIPYIFYKSDANTTIVVDRKYAIEKEPVALDGTVKSDFWANADDNTKDFLEEYVTQGQYNLTDMVNNIDKPVASKVTYTVFNSSYNQKSLRLNLTSNNTSKFINVTDATYTLNPFDFRLINLIEPIAVEDYTDSYDSGIAEYELSEYDSTFDTTTVLDTAYLPIPSMDDYIRTMMNVFDRVAKLTTIEYSKNEWRQESGNEQKQYQEKKLQNVSIISNNSDYKLSKNPYNLQDIDYRFYIDRTFNISVPYDRLQDIIDFFEPIGDIIYIKVPILSNGTSVNIGDYNLDDHKDFWTNINNDSTGISISINNYYDTENSYLYLVGKRTDVNEWTFEMKGQVYYKNYDILDRIIYYNDYYHPPIEFDVNKFTQFNFSGVMIFFEPLIMLHILFKDYGQNLSVWLLETFTSTIPSNVQELLKDISDEINTTSLSSQFNTSGLSSLKTENLTLPIDGVSDIYVDNNIDFFNSNTSEIERHKGVNFSYKNVEEGDKISSSFKKYYNYLSNDQESYLENNIDDVQEWTFDEIYDSVLGDNIINRIMAGNGLYKLYFTLSTISGIKTDHDVKIYVDDGFEHILWSRFGTSIENEDTFEIKYDGDSIGLFDSNYITLACRNLNFGKMSIIIDGIPYRFGNRIKSLYDTLTAKILESPIKVKTIDYNKHPISIISDTNYKLIMEIPVEVFKATDSYVTIDKVRVADNFINETDYCITFGDSNERYNVKSNNEKLIGKTIDKFDDVTRFNIKAFNVSNQSGEYYSSLLIYYTFNGEQFVEQKDIRFQVKLPAVLDNEYLITTVTRLDSVSTNYDLESSGGKFSSDFAPDDNVIYDVFKGTAGCDENEPDLKFNG